MFARYDGFSIGGELSLQTVLIVGGSVAVLIAVIVLILIRTSRNS